MIPGQLIANGNFLPLRLGLTPVTVHINFNCSGGGGGGGGGHFYNLVTILQHQITRHSEVTFLHVNRTQKLPWGKIVLCMFIIDVWNKFPK